MVKESLTVDGIPVCALTEETLTDGSKAWNLVFSNTTIPCLSEKKAHDALFQIHQSLAVITNSIIDIIP